MKNTLVAIDGLYIIYHSIFRTVRIWSYKNKQESELYLNSDMSNSSGFTDLLESKTFKDGLNMSIMHTVQRISDIVSNALPEYSGLEPNTFANHLFLIDDKTSNGFRKAIYPEYKEQRKVARAKYNFDLAKVRNYVLNYLLDEINLWDRMDYKRVFVEGSEADDIIYILMTEYGSEFQNKILIASDQDLLQIPNITQFDLQGKLITRKDSKNNLINENDFLLRKIIMGDNSDNIPAILPRYGKVKAEKLVNNIDQLKKLLSENKDAYRQFKLNKDLMDMSKMPHHLKDKIKNELKTIMDSMKDSHDLDFMFEDAFYSISKPI